MCRRTKRLVFFPNFFSLLMINCWLIFFLQGLPTHLSVSTANLAHTAQTQDPPAAPPAPLIPTPTRVPLFAVIVKQKLMLVLIIFFFLCISSTHLHPLHIVCSCTETMWSACKAEHLVATEFLSLLLSLSCRQYLVQGAASQGLHVRTATTFTRTPPVTLRER